MERLTDQQIRALSDEDLAAHKDAAQAACSAALSSGRRYEAESAYANGVYAEIDRRARGGRRGAAPVKTQYHYSDSAWKTLSKHPKVSGAFAAEKGLWQGRKVAAVWLAQRGNARRRTDMRVTYGTLDLTAGDANQIGVRLADGQAFILHVNRVKDLHDMTRTK